MKEVELKDAKPYEAQDALIWLLQVYSTKIQLVWRKRCLINRTNMPATLPVIGGNPRS